MSERYLKGVNYTPRGDGKCEAVLLWDDGQSEFRVFNADDMESVKKFLFSDDSPSESRFRGLMPL